MVILKPTECFLESGANARYVTAICGLMTTQTNEWSAFGLFASLYGYYNLFELCVICVLCLRMANGHHQHHRRSFNAKEIETNCCHWCNYRMKGSRIAERKNGFGLSFCWCIRLIRTVVYYENHLSEWRMFGLNRNAWIGFGLTTENKDTIH